MCVLSMQCVSMWFSNSRCEDRLETADPDCASILDH